MLECGSVEHLHHILLCSNSPKPLLQFSTCILMLSVSVLVKCHSVGVKKINKGGHKISGKKLRLKADRKPLLSELQHAITFSSDSVTSQVMQSPAQPQQDTQSKIKNLATSRSTNEAGASSTSTSAQGIALATATDKHPITETEVSESTIEQIKPESVPSHFGSPVKAQSAPFDSRVVRVEGVLPDWDEETLNMAFDDEDEGGGEIEDNGIQIKGDEALITFKDPEGMNIIVTQICQFVQISHSYYTI